MFDTTMSLCLLKRSLTILWEVITSLRSSQCPGIEDTQVNSTPTSTTTHGTARVEHVVEYLKLAKMKCILVDELSAMNQLAEDVVSDLYIE